MFVINTIYNFRFCCFQQKDEEFVANRFVDSIVKYIDMTGGYISNKKEKELFNWIIANTSFRDKNQYDETAPHISKKRLANVAYNWLKNNGYKIAAEEYKKNHKKYDYQLDDDKGALLYGVDEIFKKYALNI